MLQVNQWAVLVLFVGLWPLLIHGHIKDVSLENVIRRIDHPLLVYQRPFEQPELRRKLPEILTHQHRPGVDIDEVRPVIFKPSRGQ